MKKFEVNKAKNAIFSILSTKKNSYIPQRNNPMVVVIAEIDNKSRNVVFCSENIVGRI